MNRFALVLCLSCVLLAGCGQPAGPVPITISGSVQFEGAPVEEGQVSFQNETTGQGGQGDLTVGGKFQLEVPAGTYQVVVTPLLVTVDSGPNSPPSEEYKKVDNIPTRYRSGATSGLTATVAEDKTTHDFTLSKK